jgi:hypothetical protein
LANLAGSRWVSVGGRVSAPAVLIAPDGGGFGLGVTFMYLAGLGAAFLVGMNGCRSVDVVAFVPVAAFLPRIRGSSRTPSPPTVVRLAAFLFEARAVCVFPFPVTPAKDDSANSLLPARSTFSGNRNVKSVRIGFHVTFYLQAINSPSSPIIDAISCTEIFPNRVGHATLNVLAFETFFLYMRQPPGRSVNAINV